MTIDPKEVARQELAMFISRTGSDVSLVRQELLEMIEDVARNSYIAGTQENEEDEEECLHEESECGICNECGVEVNLNPSGTDWNDIQHAHDES